MIKLTNILDFNKSTGTYSLTCPPWRVGQLICQHFKLNDLDYQSVVKLLIIHTSPHLSISIGKTTSSQMNCELHTEIISIPTGKCTPILKLL